MSKPLEHDYIGLAERASMAVSERSSSLNLKETELRLGLPGCESPERKSGGGVSLFGRDLQKSKGSLKRVFSDTIDDRKWVFCSEGENNNTHKISRSNKAIQNKNPEASATKAQIVGWPPIRSFRRNTMACNVTKNSEEDDEEEEEEEEAGSCGCLYVKVSMDGAPYLRKVDLRTYTNYLQLSSALESMFSCFTIGQCSSGKDGLISERCLKDLVDGCEYVLTYEDKDGDWMLVGDVPWEMFIESCRRLRIMKGSEAIGLAPRAMEKSRS